MHTRLVRVDRRVTGHGLSANRVLSVATATATRRGYLRARSSMGIIPPAQAVGPVGKPCRACVQKPCQRCGRRFGICVYVVYAVEYGLR